MLSRCSHVLVHVEDLGRAVRDYRDLGFEVSYASAEHKALHAHVWFADGPVIELLTTPRGARLMRWPLEVAFGRGAGRRMVRWSRQPEGFCDVAVLVPDEELDQNRARLRAVGVPTGRAVRWTRTRPDGELTRFRFSYPRADRLPFLVTPYDPSQHPSAVSHANGATALCTVVFGVREADLPAVRAVVGDDPLFRLEPAAVTGVRAIELAGLRAALDPARAHGAVIRPAP